MTFTFKLERADGTPADPPTIRSAVPDMRPGDTIPIRPGRTLRVVATVPRPATSRPSWSSRTWPKERLATPPDVP
jgi:hypothetical protein